MTFPFGKVEKRAFDRLAIPASSREVALLSGGVVYLYCPDGYGRTKINSTWWEKALGVPCTTRNWNTVLAIARVPGRRPQRLGHGLGRPGPSGSGSSRSTGDEPAHTAGPVSKKKPRRKRGLSHVSVRRCQAGKPLMANSPTPARSTTRSTSPTGPRNGMPDAGAITDIEYVRLPRQLGTAESVA